MTQNHTYTHTHIYIILYYIILCILGHGATYQRISAVDYTFPSYVSDLARDLINGLLQYDPSNRATIDTVINHPWIALHTQKVKKTRGGSSKE